MYHPRSYTIVDNLSSEEINQVWNNACSMNGTLADTHRYDHNKRVIHKNSYRMHSKMGWYM